MCWVFRVSSYFLDIQQFLTCIAVKSWRTSKFHFIPESKQLCPGWESKALALLFRDRFSWVSKLVWKLHLHAYFRICKSKGVLESCLSGKLCLKMYFFNFSCMFLNPNNSNLSYLRNFQEQVKKGFCYQKLFWPFTVCTNCIGDLKFFADSWPSALNFKKNLDH